jgi:hypothetical protein
LNAFTNVCLRLSFPDAPPEFQDINNDRYKIPFTVNYNPHTPFKNLKLTPLKSLHYTTEESVTQGSVDFTSRPI